jgi:multiple sugar transport system substrate-binding protein
MPTSRRHLLRSLSLALPASAAPGLAACAIGRQDAPAAPAARAAGKVELWSIYANSPAGPKIKADIERKYPGLTLDVWEAPVNNEIPTKLTVAAAGGTPPDCIYINAPFWRDCARLLQPLDAFIKRDAKRIDYDDYLPISPQAATVRGKVMGLGLEVAVRVFWFNTSIFQEKGVPPPVRPGGPSKLDYKQQEELAQQLTFPRGEAAVFGLFVNRGWFEILTYVTGFGGTFLDADHTRCLLDSPQAIAGMEYAFELVDRKRLSPATGGIAMYEQANTVAMLQNNAARAQNLRRTDYGVRWDVGPVVQGPAAPLTFAFVHHAGIAQGAKNPEGGWTAIAEWTGRDANRHWMTGHGWPAARKSYLDTYVREGEAPPESRQNVVEWMKVSPVVTMPAGHNGTIQPAAQTIMNEAIAGQRTPRDAATALAREVTSLLEKT